jgi:uncharacterized protein (UPF0332 family)
MSASASPELERAALELKAACVLADGGFTAQAVSRAYYAARYAAEAALKVLGELGELGERPDDHEAVISSFQQDVVRDRELAAVHGQVLASLFEQRLAADYGLEEPEPNETWIAIESAEHLVEAVRNWIANQRS